MTALSRTFALLGILIVPPVSACADDSNAVDEAEATTARQTLRWKRARALQNDLAAALDLDPEAICLEIEGSDCATVRRVTLVDWLMAGGMDREQAEAECALLQGHASCVDDTYIDLYSPIGVHVSALGGASPFLGEQYRGLAGPLVTTPLALDRMVLSACGERAALDAQGSAEVFVDLDLAADVDPSSASVETTIVDLYRRLLARDPEASEVGVVAAIADAEPPVSGERFAQLACYAIATTAEFCFQ